MHRAQVIPGPCPIRYSGSPLQLDFGEGDNDSGVLVVEAHPGTPAEARTVAVRGGRRLRTVRGTLAELRALADHVGDDHLRVGVREAARVGLGDEVRALLPGAVDVMVEPPAGGAHRSGHRPARRGRSPVELFGEYLTEQGVDDPSLVELFAAVHEDAHAPG
jgi:exonuclease SbcD